jgi:SAM-dependent methyltransferase
VVGDCLELGKSEDGSFDVVFASNLLEHPYREASNRLLTDAKRVLRPGGRLILVQSNVRLNRGHY